MGWFDGLKYDALETWVPTSGTVPRRAAHAVARLKGAIFQEDLVAKAAGDQVGRQRAWKAISFLDRMLFAEARGAKAKRQKGTKAEVVISRVRRAWRGDWGALHAEAEGLGLGGQGSSGNTKPAGIKSNVRAVEA
jgi:hypothetical protein